MTTTALMPEGRQRYFDNNGQPAAGCELYTYAAGTSTLKTAYQDAAGTIPHPNPITLDAKGEAVIYWSGAYKVDLKTADGQQITGYPVDNINTDPAGLWGILASYASSIGSSLMGWIQAGANAVARTVQDKLRDHVNVKDFGALSTNSDAQNKVALQKAITAYAAIGARIVVPADISYGYKVADRTTWPDFTGVTKPMIVEDLGPGKSYAGFPTAYDGCQQRIFMHTPQTTSPGQHDGNGFILKGAWAPYFWVDNTADLTGARAVTDNRRADILTAINGKAVWRFGQGSLEGAAYTDLQLANYALQLFGAASVASPVGDRTLMIVDAATGSFWFNTDSNASDAAYHFKSRAAGLYQGVFESLGTTCEVALRNSSGTGQDLSLRNVAGTFQVYFPGVGSGLDIDRTNRRVGIGVTPSYKLDVLDSRNSDYAMQLKNGGATDGSVLKMVSNTAQAATWNFLACYANTGADLRLTIDGTGNVKNANNSYGAISDRKLKKHVKTARNYLPDLLKVRVVKYALKNEKTDKATHLGVIAQELAEIFPGLVDEIPDMREVVTTRKTTRTRQKMEKRRVQEGVAVVTEQNGRWVEHTEQQEREIEVAAVIEHPLFHPDGSPVMVEDAPALKGPNGEILRAATYKQKIHLEPVMETVEIEEEHRELVPTGTTTKSVKYSVFVPMLITAVQDLAARLEKRG